VTVADLKRAVVAGYFYPILRKKLVVDVVDEAGQVIVIDAETIGAVVETLNGDVGVDTTPLLKLAKASLKTESRVLLTQPGGSAPKWSPACVPETVVPDMHARMEAGELLAVRVPMQVRLKGREPADCFFDVFLQRDAAAGEGQIVFIREGIIIADVRPRRTSGIRALVVVDEGPLASFLGDSENPSHTEWQKELVRDKYSFHAATIDYVAQSVPSILSILSQRQKTPETSLLIDLFSLPSDNDTDIKTKQRKAKKKDGGESDDDDVIIPKVLKRFFISKRDGGFVVRRGDAGAKRPPMLAIKVAYGVRRGSPFAKYNPADFRLGLGGVTCNVVGSAIVEFDENWVLVQIDEDDFEIAVTGFDTSHRDLHVDVKVRGEDSDSDQAEEQPEVAYAAAS
jgi:hypothetical protein